MAKHIRFDWAMKRLLRQKSNFGILEGFLSELLMQDIKILEILDSESNKLREDDKFNRVDILVKSTNDELMLIEVQNNKEHDYFHRMNYGQAKLTTEHINAGDKYDKIKKVFSVNIVYFELGQGEDYIYKGKTEFIGIHKNDNLRLSYKQKEEYQNIKEISDIFTTYYIIKVNNFDGIARNTLDEWIYFLKKSEIKKEFKAKGLTEAKEKMRTDNLEGDDKYNYDSYIKDQRIRASEIDTAVFVAKSETKKQVENKLLPIIEQEKKKAEQ
jgi:predicted transposase/invertase (TIGR01784 family)